MSFVQEWSRQCLCQTIISSLQHGEKKDYLGDYKILFYQYRLISIAGHQEWTVLLIPYCKQQSV